MAALSILARIDDEELTDLDLSGSTPAVAIESPPARPLTVVTTPPVPIAPATPTPLTSERDAFYATLERSEAARLQATAARLNDRHRAVTKNILEIGRELIAIKDSIPGHFDRWLELDFEMAKATAWNYINVAQKFGDVPKVVEILPPATAYRLAAKATPEDVRNAIVQEIMTGATPTKEDVESRIAEARSKAAVEAQARKQAEREQADAERQQREDEQAWKAHAAKLAEAGKTEAEIKKELQKWNTAKQQKERQKERRLAAKQKEAEVLQRENEEWRAESERKRQTAHELAHLLRETLGHGFEAFRSLLTDADVHEFKSAVLAEPSGQ